MAGPQRRQRGLAAYERGLRAETKAALWLMLKGYRVIARREKTRAGEIDLIARRGKVVAFIEVKARGDVDGAAEALGAAQRERLARAASLYVASRPALQAFDMRFDLMLVAPRSFPRHIPDAWQM